MNTPNGTLFLEAIGTKTEDTFTAGFFKEDLQGLFCYWCRVFLSRISEHIALILS